MPPLNLIDKALEEALKWRQFFNGTVVGITEGLTPKSRYSTNYLRVRESLNRGCREAVKLINVPYKRSMAYSILMEACYTIFHGKKTIELMNHYNSRLDDLIDTH